VVNEICEICVLTTGPGRGVVGVVGVIAIAGSWLLPVIEVPGVQVLRSIGVTDPLPKVLGNRFIAPEEATYADNPSGVIAIASGLPPTVIGVPGVFVARSIGTTAPTKSATYAVDLSGVIAIALG
jgi:hypothetical protein